jgi:beta-lactamase regulating signal transducer with metallopeptidase domain
MNPKNTQLAASGTAVVAMAACMFGPDASGLRPVAAALLISATAVASWYVAVIALHGLRHHRLARRIRRESTPGTEAGIAVRVVDTAAGPFVAGLRQPSIYCPLDLADRLEPAELRAVLLHEEHHRRTHAPLRLLPYDALVAAIPIPVMRGWASRARAVVEIEADRDALRAGASRSALAAALLRLSDSGPIGAAGFATAAELRGRALLGEDPLAARSAGSAAFAVGTLGLALACLTFYLR